MPQKRDRIQYGGIMAMLFAALHPNRTQALPLGNTTACYLQTPDYPSGMTKQEVEQYLNLFRASWGTEEFVKLFSPSYNTHSLRMNARLLRGAATPRKATAHFGQQQASCVRDASEAGEGQQSQGG